MDYDEHPQPLEDAETAGALDLRVAERFLLIQRLGEGSYGLVYQARDIETGDAVAVKLEHRSTGQNFWRVEAENYARLRDCVGVPRMLWAGEDCEYGVVVMDLLGPSLGDVFRYCEGRFSMKTVLMLTDQLIARLQDIHSADLIHRDIKPNNFLLGSASDGNTVFVIDFGMMAERKPDRGVILDPHELHGQAFGTAEFASRRAHESGDQCPRDDLESLGYMLIYFATGSLPWQAIPIENEEERNDAMWRMKTSIDTEELCAGLPGEFLDYMGYVRSMTFTEIPDYPYIRQHFRQLFVRYGYDWDHVFDWTERRCREMQMARERERERSRR